MPLQDAFTLMQRTPAYSNSFPRAGSLQIRHRSRLKSGRKWSSRFLTTCSTPPPARGELLRAMYFITAGNDHCLAHAAENAPEVTKGVIEELRHSTQVPREWKPGVSHNAGSFHFETRYGEQITQQQRCPAVEMLVHVLLVVRPLIAPCLERNVENDLPVLLQSATERTECFQRVVN